MKIPKTIKIGGLDYEVIVKDRSKEDGITNAGTHYQYEQKIWIDNKCHQQQQEETLIHEIIEAINTANEVGLEHNQVSVLSNQLYQVLKDNSLLKE